MKRLIVVATLVLMVGVAQQALADPPKGVLGCGGIFISSTVRVVENSLRFRNWGDSGNVTLEDITIYDPDGNILTVVNDPTPVTLGPHESIGSFKVGQDLLGLSVSGPPVKVRTGLQVIVKWSRTGDGKIGGSSASQTFERDGFFGPIILPEIAKSIGKCLDLTH